MALRLIFMGSADFSCVILRALVTSAGFEVIGVVTQPDKPKGRELKLKQSPVKELAMSLGLPVLQPLRAREEGFIEQLRKFRPDLIVVAAYGQILPQTVLDLPQFGCLNVHTSLLPKYRGAAPIQWAILNDQRETGVTIMKMDAGLDTGAILTQGITPIAPQDSAETLLQRLAKMGAELLVETIPDFIGGRIQPRPQPAEGVIYAPKIKKEDGRLDWNQPARALWNRVRGLLPWPGAFTYLNGHTLLKIWQAEVLAVSGRAGEILEASKAGISVGCGEGALRLTVLQREGGRRLAANEFLTGHRLEAGHKLG